MLHNTTLHTTQQKRSRNWSFLFRPNFVSSPRTKLRGFFRHYFVSFLLILLPYTSHIIVYHASCIMYLARNLIDFIFPRECITCETTGAYLCKKCKKRLEPHPEICPYCHRISKDYRTCIECRCNKNNYLEGIIIPFAYTDLLKKLIIKLKYFHKKDIGSFLIERLTIALQVNESFQKELHTTQASILTPQLSTRKLVISFIPSHRYRHHFIKGYNQSQLLAKILSQYLQVPMVTVARKIKRTKTQASLDRNGRLHNLSNAFSLEKNLPLIGDETILIIDDITTTGSTINELGKLIKHGYPHIKVRGAVL